MGADSFTIHTDGVIERGKELEPVLLNILEVGSHKMSPLAALKAQRKCFKIAKKERTIDYREYVERLQLVHYALEFKKAEIGRRLSFFISASCCFLLPGLICSLLWVNDDALDLGLVGIALLIISGLCIWKSVRLIKKINSLSQA